MKLKYLLTSLALLMSVATANAQTEVTEIYLQNADFSNSTMVDDAPFGWALDLTSAGVQSKMSAVSKGSGLIPGGQYHWQLSQSSGSITGRAHQVVTNVTPGRYRVTAAVYGIFNGTVDLFLNDATTAVTTRKGLVYEVEALVPDGNLDLGLELKTYGTSTIDFDDFHLYQSELTPDDYNTILESLHDLCVADTTRDDRQRWYNHDEMATAFNAYDAAVADASKIEAAIPLLQQAHTNFLAITNAYNKLMVEVAKLNELVSGSPFAGCDSVASVLAMANLYYTLDEDHYEWVVSTLDWVAQTREAYGWFGKLVQAISVARNQLLATDYEGKDALRTAISNANDAKSTSMDPVVLHGMLEALQQAQATYLANRPSEWITIQNGLLWKTNTGSTVQAHAPGFVRVGDIWYMCGEDRSRSWNPDVNLYSSTDLVNWKYERKIITNRVTTPELGRTRMIERPKLLYNEQTGKYLVWCHYEASDYSASEAACFECDSVNGDYHYIWSGRPLGVKSRDCNVYQDPDGTAYFVSTTEENQHLGLFRLSADYHEAVEHTKLFGGMQREAPAIIKIAERYFMFNSACSGWDPNQCKMAYTNDLTKNWTSLSNVGNPIAFDTQAAAILEIKGTKTTTYLYVGDRWQDPDLPNTKTIIFPIMFNGTRCDFRYHERFDINFVTGEWRETPVDTIFASKKDWSIVDFSSEETASSKHPATHAIDGNTATIWHTQYSSPAAEPPHHITADMGNTLWLQGFLATPRLDTSSSNGLIRKYQFLTSLDGEEWTTVSQGTWLPYCTVVSFTPIECRYLRLVSTEGDYATVAELDVVLDPRSVEANGIENPMVDNANPTEIVSRSFYTIDGRLIGHGSQPARTTSAAGLIIEKAIHADGSVTVSKRISR